jgi:hypothetical protein
VPDRAACLLLRIPQAAAGASVRADDRCERTAQAVVERAVLDSTLAPLTQVGRGGLSVSPHLIHFTPTTAPQQLLHRALPCRCGSQRHSGDGRHRHSLGLGLFLSATRAQHPTAGSCRRQTRRRAGARRGRRRRYSPSQYAPPGCAGADRSGRPTNARSDHALPTRAGAHRGKRRRSAPSRYAPPACAQADQSADVPEADGVVQQTRRRAGARRGRTQHLHISSVCPSRVRRSRPVWTSHKRTVLITPSRREQAPVGGKGDAPHPSWYAPPACAQADRSARPIGGWSCQATRRRAGARRAKRRRSTLSWYAPPACAGERRSAHTTAGQ